MQNVDLVLVVKMINAANTPVVRVVAFEVCPDTGARSVYDLMEADAVTLDGVRWLARVAEEYDAPVMMSDYVTEWPLDSVDTGRARKTSSRIMRALEEM